MYLAGVAVGYIANYRWTFKNSKNRGAIIRYVQMHISGYMINLLLLFVFVDFLKYPHQIVQISAIIVIAALSFIACKLYVFRND